MKNYHFVLGAVLVAVLAVYGRYGRQSSNAVPTQPAPTETAQQPPGDLPPLPTIPSVELPKANPPLDIPLIIVTEPESTLPAPPVVEIPSVLVSTVGAPAPAALPMTVVAAPEQVSGVQPPPVIPNVPSVPLSTLPGNLPVVPVTGSAPPPVLVAPAPPTPVPAPTATTPAPLSVRNPVIVVPPQNASAAPVQAAASEALSPTRPVAFPKNGKFLVLKPSLREETASTSPNADLIELMSSRLIKIDGVVKVEADKLHVCQGAIYPFYRTADVLFVGETREQVYGYMRGRASLTDPLARMAVAKWCMFNGLREQAVAEAREVLRLQPENKVAAEMIRSLEASLKEFPSENSATASKPQEEKLVVCENEWEVTPEAAASFTTRVQPILANLCVDCHAKADCAGTFKLTRISEFDSTPQNGLKNLRAVTAQLKRTEPLNSPFLIKAVTPHGGQKQPSFANRVAAGYRLLELWVTVAVGPGSTIPSAPAAGFSPTAVPAQPGLPAVGTPKPGGLPPVEGFPVSTPAVTTPTTSNPATPAVPAIPAVPAVPSVPQSSAVPQVLPTPPGMVPSVPVLPPSVPVTDGTPKLLPQPGTPSSPPLSIPVVPNSIKTAGGSQFGTGAPLQSAQPKNPMGNDEFDPAGFNQKK